MPVKVAFNIQLGATHSSILAWEIPWTEEPGGLQSRGGHKESGTTEHKQDRDFPAVPVAKTLHSRCRGLGSITGQGTRSHMQQLDPIYHS